MKTFIYCFALGLIICYTSYSQDLPQCGTTEYWEEILNEDSLTRLRVQENEKLIRITYDTKQIPIQKLIIIPVVVHVVWNTPDQNVSDAQILSQINVLNEDFRRMLGTNGYNNKKIGADTKVEFRLAQKDKQGRKINGITRVQTTVPFFTNKGPDKDRVKFSSKGGADAWDARHYLNLWVCKLRTNLLGYATFPGGASNLDGVVIGYEYFGDKVGTTNPPHNLGRTSTHEIGHWLNLYHTFRGGCPNTNCLDEGDFVCDTPPVASATQGCPKSRISCGDSTLIDDYMDYSTDACMNLFTLGQNYRIRITLDAIRDKIASSPALDNETFTIFGEHVGSYSYVLDKDFSIQGTGPYSPFRVDVGSSVSLDARNGSSVVLGYNTRIIKGAGFVVTIDH